MKVLYFASLRESLSIAEEIIQIESGTTVINLRKQLIKKYGKQHFNHILCAVNHELASDKTKLNNCDEVAFYPPVTGG